MGLENETGEYVALFDKAAETVTSSRSESRSSTSYDGGSRIQDPEQYAIGAATVSGIIAALFALVIFFAFVIRKKDPNSGFAKWWKEFWNFRKIWIAGLMKFIYLLVSFFLINFGIATIIYGFMSDHEQWVMILGGLGVMIVGNIVLRLVFELVMLMVGLWENTADIRGALVGARQRVEAKRVAEVESKPEPKPESKPEPKPEA